MTREPLTVSPDTPLETAIGMMQQSRFGCLPVVENELVVGILTRSDLVDALQRLLSGKSARRYAAPS
jgi:acetoin utilization protein AcuB